jgi:dTDP-4-dehydrorhamnose reductase
MTTIAITGATGLIGSRVVELLSDQFSFIPLRIEDGIDITNATLLEQKLNNIRFDFLLHFAAYTNVDRAEIERDLCYTINVEGTRNVMNLCEAKNAKLVFTSTDFVFDGRSKHPLHENSTPNPIGYYGRTKYDAEQLVKNNAMIVRLTTPYRKHFPQKKDVVRVIRSFLEEGKRVAAITDNLVVPTFVDDIALALGCLVRNYATGIFHVVGPQAISSFQMSQMIARRWGLNESLITQTTHEEYSQNRAPRPQFSNIITTKDLGVVMRSFEEGLQSM